ncbi:hypothetical protein DD238_005303 [Peronospora effusa]|uniref:Embryonic stem cell-specific 5-hydroxymethylcytosine-binding protein n=1 Tax=Peronospora effusa TaxID=542832 RepID=A0A3M6VNT1_9STRA|nr:hypothetical protein DD238_005303 [Peronospora effusa]
MCGRSRCTLTREQVVQVAGVAPEDFVNGDNYNPVENMGPGRYGPVLLQHGGAKVESERSEKTRLQAMRWGMVPSFAKANAKPDHFRMFNARSENLRERPAFKRVLESKRCVVLCEGYYEWQQVGKREKQPFYFYREGSVMKFAGLYDHWKSEAGELMYTYTILTTAIAPELKWLHTRMPVILSDIGVDRWLSGAKFEDLKDLLTSYRSNDLKWHPVDKKGMTTVTTLCLFQSEDCAKKVNIKHAGIPLVYMDSSFPIDMVSDAPNLLSLGQIEKQNPSASSPIAPSEQAKMEKVIFCDSTPGSRLEKHDVNSDTSPKKQSKEFSTKFIPASSLLDKRFDEGNHDLTPSKLPTKRRRVSSPTKKTLK